MTLQFCKELIASMLDNYIVFNPNYNVRLTFYRFSKTYKFKEKFSNKFTGKDIRKSIKHIVEEDKKWLNDLLNSKIKNKTKYECDYAENYLIYFRELCDVNIYVDVGSNATENGISQYEYCYFTHATDKSSDVKL